MIRFSVLPSAVVALAAFRSTEANRPILNAVHLAPDGTMTATNGHILLTWRNAAKYDGEVLAVVSPEIAAAFGMADLPNTASTEGYVLEISPAVLKLAKMRKCARLALAIDGERATWNAVTDTGFFDDFAAVLARVLEGPYPKYRQVIPRTVPDVVGTLPAINAEYLGRFALATGNLSSNGVTLTPTGSARPVVVTFADNPDAFGLIMPVNKDGERAIPAWVHPATPANDTDTAETVAA